VAPFSFALREVITSISYATGEFPKEDDQPLPANLAEAGRKAE